MTPVMLALRISRRTLLMPSLLDPFRPGVVAPYSVLSICFISLRPNKWQHNNKDEDVLSKKYTLTLLKGCVWEGVGDRTELQHILTPTLLAITAFLSRSPVLLNQGPEAHSARCWLSLPHLFTNWSGLQTNRHPVFPELYNSSTSRSSCGRYKLLSFNPSMIKAILCYSSTRCTCYLHRCISFFDSQVGSQVNIQHIGQIKLHI